MKLGYYVPTGNRVGESDKPLVIRLNFAAIWRIYGSDTKTW